MGLWHGSVIKSTFDMNTSPGLNPLQQRQKRHEFIGTDTKTIHGEHGGADL